MNRSRILALILAAVLIFGFVSISSEVEAIGGIGETIRELSNNETFREHGGVPPTEEFSREAGEWQTEAAEMARETELGWEEWIEPPDGEAEWGNESLEELREGPLGGGGGGGCDYGGGWCPPSCPSCSPPAY